MSLRDRITNFFRRLFRREEPAEIIPVLEPEIEEKVQPILPEPEPELIVEAPEEKEEVPFVEEKELVKLVIFYERITGTRIRRKVIRSFPVEMSDEEIQRILHGQYDNGGNFVIGVESISIGEFEEREREIERGLPGSADVSP